MNKIDLAVGDPSGSPDPILRAKLADAMLHPSASHYISPQGLAITQDAVSTYFKENHSVTVAPENVLITHGARGSLYFALLATGRNGPCGYLKPGYMFFASLTRDAGMTPVPVPLPDEPLDSTVLKRMLTPIRGGVLILNSPHNPTGRVLLCQELEALAKVVEELDIRVISDFVYGDLFQSVVPQSALAFIPRAIEVISISKPFRACGYRVGAVTGDPPWVAATAARYASMNGVPYAFQQTAAVAWTQMPGVASFRADLAARRTLVVNELRQLDFQIDMTLHNAGAMFVWAKIPAHIASAGHLCKLLASVGVLIADGLVFGSGCERFVRIALNVPVEQLAEAMSRLSRIMEVNYEAA